MKLRPQVLCSLKKVRNFKTIHQDKNIYTIHRLLPPIINIRWPTHTEGLSGKKKAIKRITEIVYTCDLPLN